MSSEKSSIPEISIVVPLFNEESVFNILVTRLNEIINKCHYSIEVLMVDDGSQDQTPELMTNLAESDANYHCVFLSRNFGHQAAVSAGLENCLATKAVMIMDADLQDPPELIFEFNDKIDDGYDVVFAIRKNRKETLLKKLAYWSFYRFQKKITSTKMPLDSGDFSMLSRRVVDYINSMPEKSRFLRGMRAWVGFKQIGVEYERNARQAGETKYSIQSLIKLATDGIFNFSDLPLKLITRLGLYTIVLSIIYISIIIVKRIFYDNVPEGYTTIIVSLALFSGVQLISLGVIGEYLHRIYDQTRQRPLYIIDKKIRNKKKTKATIG
ncbi:MAG TPA: glycosyltransferase family 2 protein [Fulvivirga sp.]|nr:glycosyltransferase family 2 protein [Fulvivirga sp.]